MKPQEIEKEIEKFLLNVQKPGRYVGGEFNSIYKDSSAIQTRIALAFPDIYDLGVPNLGIAIFYDLLNKLPNVWAERVYLPWEDMEKEMRERNIPLYTLESKTPVNQMDILGITIPYESLYTNVLNLLDLSGLSVFAAERSEDDPLVIAGGHSTYNRNRCRHLSMHSLSEKEKSIPEIVTVYQLWKKRHCRNRNCFIELSKVEGFTSRFLSNDL